MLSGKETREPRVLARISGSICERVGVGRARLSEIECDHVVATSGKVARIVRALEAGAMGFDTRKSGANSAAREDLHRLSL